MIYKYVLHGSAEIHVQIQLLLNLLLRMNHLKYTAEAVFPDGYIPPVGGKNFHPIGPKQRHVLYNDLAADLKKPGQLHAGNRFPAVLQYIQNLFPSFFPAHPVPLPSFSLNSVKPLKLREDSSMKCP